MTQGHWGRYSGGWPESPLAVQTRHPEVVPMHPEPPSRQLETMVNLPRWGAKWGQFSSSMPPSGTPPSEKKGWSMMGPGPK